jgi:hypothetical protein
MNEYVLLPLIFSNVYIFLAQLYSPDYKQIPNRVLNNTKMKVYLPHIINPLTFIFEKSRE